jgi:hypothetical protein
MLETWTPKLFDLATGGSLVFSPSVTDAFMMTSMGGGGRLQERRESLIFIENPNTYS